MGLTINKKDIMNTAITPPARGIDALMPFTAQLLEEISREVAELDYAGEQYALPQPREGFARTVLWKSVGIEMPDDEIAVLVYTPADAEPVWIGYHDDGKWRTPSGIPMSFAVTHWAHFPEPPPLS